MLFAFTLNTVTKILLHIAIFFTIIKSIIQCCGKNRKVAGVDSRRTSRRMQKSYAPKSSQAVSPMPNRRMSVPATPRQRDSVKPGTGKKTQPSTDDDKKQEFLPYPEVAEPTASAKQRHKDELEREKRQKIAEVYSSVASTSLIQVLFIFYRILTVTAGTEDISKHISMLFAFTITIITKILLHVGIFFTIIKSIIQCCGKNRKVAGVDSRRTSRRMQDSNAPKSSQAVSPMPNRRMSVPATPRQRDSVKPGTGKKTQPSTDDDDKKQEFLPYPEVAEPTASAKQRHKDELEREKRQKIAEGFYQEKSDQDDTLEKVASLKMEPSESAKRGASARRSFRQRRLDNESLHQRVPATARLAVT